MIGSEADTGYSSSNCATAQASSKRALGFVAWLTDCLAESDAQEAEALLAGYRTGGES